MNATIVENRHLQGDNWQLLMETPTASRSAPGQFCMLQVSNAGQDPLLRRPFSIADANESQIRILYRVVGRGTRLMTEIRPGAHIGCISPLGTGFTLESRPAILVGGGVGIAPLLLLARHLHANGIEIRTYLGAANAQDLILVDELAALSAQLEVATDDGSQGHRGLVTDLIDPTTLGGTSLYSCGPEPMMRALAQMGTQSDCSMQFSLEEHMACGIGVCLGCVRETRTAAGIDRQRICADGPVFRAQHLIWDQGVHA